MTRTYEAYGLRIRSDLPLALFEHDFSEPDVVLRAAPAGVTPAAPLDAPDHELVAADLDHEGRWYVAVRDGAGYRLRFRDCGEFVCAADGASVTWAPEPGGREDLLPLLFAGTVLAFLLTIRGELVLHASAVIDGDRALAFVGQSGRGKTTLAAVVAASGARVVTDDVLVVELGGGDVPRCRGGVGELRLRPAARALAVSFAGVRETADARVAVAGAPEVGWVALGAIVVPSPSREAERLEVRRLSPADAVAGLLAFPRVAGLRGHDILGRQLGQLAALASAVPVYDAVVPWGPPFQDGLAAQLLALAARDASG